MVGIDLAILFGFLGSLSQMNKLELWGDFQKVECDANTPRGRASEVGI